MARLVGQLGQLRQPMRRRQQGDPPTLQAPTAEALVGGDDALGEVGIDERGIDEFLVQRTDAASAKSYTPFSRPASLSNAMFQPWPSKKPKIEPSGSAGSLAYSRTKRSARSRQAAGSSGKARLRIAAGDSQGRTGKAPTARMRAGGSRCSSA